MIAAMVLPLHLAHRVARSSPSPTCGVASLACRLWAGRGMTRRGSSRVLGQKCSPLAIEGGEEVEA